MWLLAVVRGSLFVGRCRLLVVCCMSFVFGSWLFMSFVACCSSLFVVGCWLHVVVRCLPFVVCLLCLVSDVIVVLLGVYCVLFVV